MNLLKILNERDVFPHTGDPIENINFDDRVTGKAIVIDANNQVGLVGNTVNSIYVLPGGGIEKDESIKDGIVRECLEEIGCRVELTEAVGIVEDYRNRDGKHCINYCYIAKVLGDKETPKLTTDELKNGMHVKWVSFDEALDILSNEVEQLKRGEVKFYNTGFNILRDNIFLIKAKGILKV